MCFFHSHPEPLCKILWFLVGSSDVFLFKLLVLVTKIGIGLACSQDFGVFSCDVARLGVTFQCHRPSFRLF